MADRNTLNITVRGLHRNLGDNIPKVCNIFHEHVDNTAGSLSLITLTLHLPTYDIHTGEQRPTPVFRASGRSKSDASNEAARRAMQWIQNEYMPYYNYRVDMAMQTVLSRGGPIVADQIYPHAHVEYMCDENSLWWKATVIDPSSNLVLALTPEWLPDRKSAYQYVVLANEVEQCSIISQSVCMDATASTEPVQQQQQQQQSEQEPQPQTVEVTANRENNVIKQTDAVVEEEPPRIMVFPTISNVSTLVMDYKSQLNATLRVMHKSLGPDIARVIQISSSREHGIYTCTFEVRMQFLQPDAILVFQSTGVKKVDAENSCAGQMLHWLTTVYQKTYDLIITLTNSMPGERTRLSNFFDPNVVVSYESYKGCGLWWVCRVKDAAQGDRVLAQSPGWCPDQKSAHNTLVLLPGAVVPNPTNTK
eukprot:PhM_4_TR5394/c1_g1_i1/m.84150